MAEKPTCEELQKKVLEAALAESEEKYRAIVENANEGIIVSQDGMLKFVNRKGLEISGYSEAEMMSKPFIDFVYPDDRQAVMQHHLKRLKGEETPQVYVLRVITKDGAIKWLENNGVVTTWEGKPATLNLLSDITERKQAEEALRKSEEMYCVLVENAGAAVFIAQGGLLKFANKKTMELSGYTREELTSRSYIDFIHPDDRAIVLDRQLKRQQGIEGPSNYSLRIVQCSGEVKWVELNAVQIDWQDEPATLNFLRDVTERKRADDALRESEYYLAEAQHIAKIGNWSNHIGTNTVKWSDERFEIFGIDRSKFGESYESFIARVHPDDRELVIATNRDVRENRQPFDIEYRIVLPNSEVRFIHELGAGEFDKEGNIIRLFGVAQDITERRQLEKELKASHQQLRAFAGRLQQIREEERIMISREIHDVMGGGLTGLKMDLFWLMHKLENAESDQERSVLISRILSASGSIDQMIRVVRRISTDLRPPVLDDLGLIAALEWQLSEFTSRTGISHELATAFEYVSMEADTAIAVFRIFQEALTNVARHSQATKLTVILREEEKSLSEDARYVLEIRDNGRGITKEEFLNPESLGLLGMQERVLAFKGELSIRGESGGGTTLVLKLPQKQGEPS